MFKSLFLASATTVLFGCAGAQSLKPVEARMRPPEARHVYRLDFIVSANELGRAPQSSAYTLNLEEHDTGELRVGDNVSLGAQRADVGLKIRANLVSFGDDLILRSDVEMSGSDDATSMHKVSMDGAALLRGGKPSLVASLDDPASHKHYEVTATATRLR